MYISTKATDNRPGSIADGYVWMVVAVDTSELGATSNDGLPTGERYYEYILIHVDDLRVDSRRS